MPLLRGKQDFLETNIAPLAELINAGQIEVEGIAYIVRRVVVGDMANDVGICKTGRCVEGNH